MNPIIKERNCIHSDGHKEKRHYYWCPGCDALHGIAILPDKQKNGAGWAFTGTLECPTYSPSQLTKYKYAENKEFVCHTFIREGQIEFLSDCTHELKGKTLPLPPLPDWFAEERSDEC